ncbi:fructosamine kinase family protein [Thalassotalea sp. Y01]|uniref:fructosamine kinase family protein n=1 Tax=Thalassotalea sp. Y01 TaxID=2729613 RepID=UPI00145EA549|nr:fructosamine kinase family protein [Thalassotalea sp. Y01]NMP17505.1 fructosamine kinase family protein [Thalassotalea sp. Y01]
MWQSISKDIANTTKTDFQMSQTEELSGGDINRAFRIRSDGKMYFVKVNDKQNFANFEAEALNLDILNCRSDIVVPKVITLGTTVANSYLVLEYIEMHTSPLPSSDSDFFQLGVALARMHSENQQAEFGWPEDNYIGHTPQPNNYHHNWATFFSENRIRHQLQLLDAKVKNIDVIGVTRMCKDVLGDHQPIPSLLHGDLWQGNVAFTHHYPCLFDPACYYGDREVDLAMTELFGRFEQSFYDGYQATSAIDSDYEQRKLIYNFYHIINHANMFGGIYVDQVHTFIKQIQKLT